MRILLSLMACLVTLVACKQDHLNDPLALECWTKAPQKYRDVSNHQPEGMFGGEEYLSCVYQTFYQHMQNTNRVLKIEIVDHENSLNEVAGHSERVHIQGQDALDYLHPEKWKLVNLQVLKKAPKIDIYDYTFFVQENLDTGAGAIVEIRLNSENVDGSIEEPNAPFDVMAIYRADLSALDLDRMQVGIYTSIADLETDLIGGEQAQTLFKELLLEHEFMPYQTVTELQVDMLYNYFGYSDTVLTMNNWGKHRSNIKNLLLQNLMNVQSGYIQRTKEGVPQYFHFEFVPSEGSSDTDQSIYLCFAFRNHDRLSLTSVTPMLILI